MGNLWSRLWQSAEQKDKKEEIHIHSTNKNKRVNKPAKRRDSHEEINHESQLYKDKKLKSKKNVKAIKILDWDAEQTSDDQNNLNKTKIKREIKELALRSAKFYYEKIGLQS